MDWILGQVFHSHALTPTLTLLCLLYVIQLFWFVVYLLLQYCFLGDVYVIATYHLLYKLVVSMDLFHLYFISFYLKIPKMSKCLLFWLGSSCTTESCQETVTHSKWQPPQMDKQIRLKQWPYFIVILLTHIIKNFPFSQKLTIHIQLGTFYPNLILLWRRMIISIMSQ